jgi:putative peptidoglycan lipid II flippase
MTLRRPRLTPRVRKLIRLGVPGVIAGGVTQINIVIGTMIASMAPGAVSYLYYADRLYQLPLGIVGIAIGVVLLPDLSRQLRAGRDDLAGHSQNRAVEFAMALTLPAAVALFVMAEPIINVLFQRGSFGPADTVATASALAAFAIGLPSFVLVKVFSPGFFAREDTRTPMWFAGIAVAVNVAVSLALFPFLAHVGIAIATAVSGWVNTVLLVVTLHRRGHFTADASLLKRLPLILLAAMLMGVTLVAARWVMAPLIASPDFAVRATAVSALVVGGVPLFAAFCQLTGAADFRRAIGLALRRKCSALAPRARLR